MDKIQDYNKRKAYIELTLSSMLKAQRGFDFIKYVKAYRTEEEYIRIGDLRGCTVTFDITAAPLEEVMRLVCDFVVTGPLGNVAKDRIVVDNEKLLSIAPLFKEVM
jgi:hypothetical protein